MSAMHQALGKELQEQENESKIVSTTEKYQSTTPLIPTPVCVFRITGREHFKIRIPEPHFRRLYFYRSREGKFCYIYTH